MKIYLEFEKLFSLETKQFVYSRIVYRELFTVWEIKRLGYPALRKVFPSVLISLLKSEEIRLALWRTPVMPFLFDFVGISN